MFTVPCQKTTQLIEVLFCVLLLFLMSQITIPLNPIPITLQSVAVMIIGLKFNRRIAVSSLSVYLLLGICGVPVFACFSSGYQTLFGGLSCGYLIGFVVAVIVMSYFNKLFESRLFVRNILSCLVGTVVIYVCGVGWLSVGMGIEQAIKVGLLPFIVSDMAKILVLVIILHYMDYGKKC